MGSGVRNPSSGDRVVVAVEGDWVAATDEETGVTSRGETKAEALENLAAALELSERPVREDEDADEPSDAPWLSRE
ncbi:type II toxin-antitoxin system HicB family antitoxin [Halomarina oriensis]|uniref:Type II toxin-antitoxin system HicB family antitoxin n=1 Tax=Halomarina oriensis TaxID=671145 RepID=A0A6B0GP95_9EURY|nr:type II toxin-antitoxin system HicB family antitoxin [Halomarina oriensis]MWG35327.1 type II toxin-antitoxin system HicB family antitoxin [Halomarina oriensis]